MSLYSESIQKAPRDLEIALKDHILVIGSLSSPSLSFPDASHSVRVYPILDEHKSQVFAQDIA